VKPYQFDDFNKNSAWLIFRLDSAITDGPIDFYMVMNLPSGDIVTFETTETVLTQSQANKLLKEAKIKNVNLPNRIIITSGDPAEPLLRKAADKLGLAFEAIASVYLEDLTAPIKQSFGEHFYSPSSIGHSHAREDTDELDQECLKKMIPDSYDPCPCASGKKYKFCCKKIFAEIMEAMAAAEEGDYTTALKWIDKAKSVVGETAEVICRESIVYSYFDGKKSNDLLAQCLSINPNHPRGHYLIGLMLKESGDIEGAVAAYQTAIRHYPPTDVFHLNEVYNNLGSAFYVGGNIEEAKSAWEKALLYLPSDKTTRRNLAEFIHTRRTG
jgi:tetratricopeptide (TPR) repeat protein